MKQFEDSLIQNQIDQIMVEDVYLQIILFLKSTFDILLFCKINFQQNWIGIYECLQKIIHSKCYFIIVTNHINNMNI